MIRSAVLGYQNQAARVGAIIAPFLVMASASGGAGGSAMVPFLVFGVASVLASLLIFTLPETLGVPLPDTMEVGGAAVLGPCESTWLGGRLIHSTEACTKTLLCVEWARALTCQLPIGTQYVCVYLLPSYTPRPSCQSNTQA